MRAENALSGAFLRAVALSAALATSWLASVASATESTSLEILPPPAPDPIEASTEQQRPAEPTLTDGDLASEYAAEAVDVAAPIDDSVIIEDGLIVSLTEPDQMLVVDDEPTIADGLGYNTSCDSINWLIGKDDRFGMVSFDSSATLPSGEKDGVVCDFSFHFLDGPVQTEMPPRLFDLVLGYQRRRMISDNIGYDVVARVGVFTDFEGSARKGVRFPGHAVAQFRMTPNSDWLLGVDVLDRDDVSLLPVVGIRWTPTAEWQLDLVFPRPSVAVRLPDGNFWAYLRGELGGGTWAIERVDLTDDNATYRDLRLALGCENRNPKSLGGVEIAYVFARDLSYRTGVGDFAMQDAVMLGFVTRR